jgi:hypothetical protein
MAAPDGNGGTIIGSTTTYLYQGNTVKVTDPPLNVMFCKLDLPFLFLTVLTIHGGLALAQPAEEYQTGRAPDVLSDKKRNLTSRRLKNEFKLEQYGFVVNIPKELIAYGPYCDSDGICGSSHGFYGTLANDAKARISLFAEYDPNLDFLLDTDMTLEEFVLGRTVHPERRTTIISRINSALGNLPATRVVATFRLPGSSSDYTVDVIFALRKVSVDEAVLYQISLTAPSENYLKDKPVLEWIINSFRATKVTG